jgi:hypothetical protein
LSFTPVTLGPGVCYVAMTRYLLLKEKGTESKGQREGDHHVAFTPGYHFVLDPQWAIAKHVDPLYDNHLAM